MSRLVLVVEVDADPTTTDPHDVGEGMVGAYDADRDSGVHDTAVSFISAEWEA